MLFKDGRFAPSGAAEYVKLILTFGAAAAQVGLNIALSVLIGSGFRSYAPWALFLAVALAAAWVASLLLLVGSFIRLTRYLNGNSSVLKDSKSALVLPLGAESLAAALGSTFLSAAVVWITKTARDTPAGVSDADRFRQFDVYFPIAIGFQVLSLPGCIRLADIFSYAESKAIREVEAAPFRRDVNKRKLGEISSGSTHSPLISAESIRAAQKELDLAKARLERQERQLVSVSTGGSAQSVDGQGKRTNFQRPLVPLVSEKHKERERERDRRDHDHPRGESSRRHPLRSGESVDADDTRITIFNEVPTKKGGVGRLFPSSTN